MALRDKLEVYKRLWRPNAPAGFFTRWCTLPICKVTIFTCVRTIVKKTTRFVMSFCRIFMKFFIRLFFESLSIQCKFHWNLIRARCMKTFTHLWQYLA